LSLSGETWELEIAEIAVGSWQNLWIVRDAVGIRANGVAFRLRSGAGSDEPAAVPAAGLQRIAAVLGQLERWLPRSEFTGLTVEFAEGAIALRGATWREGRLRLAGLEWTGEPFALGSTEWSPQVNSFSVERWSPDRLWLQLELDGKARLGLRLSPTAQDPNVSALVSALWASGQFEGEAVFGDQLWPPLRAAGGGEARALPDERWAETVSAWEPNLQWTAAYDGAREAFSARLNGAGVVPVAEANARPVPWKALLEVSGEAERLSLDQLEVVLPFVETRLSQPLAIDRATLRPNAAATLDWAVDLAASPVAHRMQGRAQGALDFSPDETLQGGRYALVGDGADFVFLRGEERWEVPRVEFSLTGGADAARAWVEACSLQIGEEAGVKGAFQWLRGEGRWGLIQLEGALNPSGLVRWVKPEVLKAPAGLTFDLEAEQAPSGWRYAGGVTVPEMVFKGKWALGGELTCKGLGNAVEVWELAVRRPGVNLSADGSLNLEPGGGRLLVSHLSETRNQGEGWTLAAPFTLDWRTVEAVSKLSLAPLLLERPGGGQIELAGDWAGWDRLLVRARVAQLRPDDAAPWLDDTVLPEVSATALNLELRTEADASGGFVWLGSGEFDATWISPRQRSWVGRGGWRLDAGRISFDGLRLQTGDTTWLHLQGAAPVGVWGDVDRVFKLRTDRAGDIDLLAELAPLERLPQPLEEVLPFQTHALRGRLEATGTLGEPIGELFVAASSLDWPETATRRAISLRDIDLHARLDGAGVELSALSLRLAESAEGQTLSGRIGDVDWEAWLEDPRVDRWIDLSGRLLLEAWPMAALGSWLPAQLEPAGSVSLDLKKAPGAWPSGDLRWEGLTTQPFAGGLVTRQITGNARLDGKRLDGLEVGGTIGGQPWSLEGWIDATEADGPRFRLGLEAERLDLVRRPDLIIRGKASLEAVREDLSRPAVLRGEVEMLRSLFLQDLESFTRQGPAGVARRPPYFSVASKPFADWELDLALRGERFLQIRSTVLVGEASAEFELGGTLGAPLLTGEAWVDGGVLLFPFARLPATELRGRIRVEEPHTVQLTGLGEGVAYGYLIQYQLSGTAADPTLAFSAVPSLPQDSILLMIATGAVPSAESGTDVTARAGRLALYLGQDIFSELFGQDGASRLEIRSGDGFSPFRRNGQVIEYQLDDEWSVLSEYDDFGGYNVDLRRKLLNR
jgi:translocation and assembly module TamB